MTQRAWIVSVVAGALVLAAGGPASGRARRVKGKPAPRATPAPPAPAPEEETEAEAPAGQGPLFSATLGAGSAPGGAMVLLGGAAAYRWPWLDRFVDLHGSYLTGLSGGSLDHLLLLDGRVGAPLGATGLTGWAGLGYRLAALGMPYGPSHIYNALALEGALRMDVLPEMRVEAGVELDYPASGPNGATFVIGVGAHAQACWRRGEVAFFGRYDLLDFHSRMPSGSLDDFVHALSLGIRSLLW